MQIRLASPLEILKMILPLPLQLITINLPPRLLIRIRVKTLCIAWIPNWWNNRPSVFPVINVFPYDALEERVFFYSCSAAGDVSEALGAVDGAELADYIFGFGGDGGFGGEVDRFGNDSAVGIS